MADPVRDRHRPAVPPRTETCRRPSRHGHLPTGSTTHFWHIHPHRADSSSLLRTGRADAKTSHADSGVLLRQPGATSNSWGGFFPPKKSLAPFPPQKDTPIPASQICNTLLPGITFQTVTSMLSSCLASCLHAERLQLQGGVDPSDAARIAHFSNAPASSDLRSCWFHQHTSTGFKSSFLL